MRFNDIIWNQWQEGIAFTNKEKTLCFFKVSKNAGTSLVEIFDTRIFTTYDKIENEDMIKFAVVRDPFTRIVSGYIEILRLRKDGPVNYTKSLPFYSVRDGRKKFLRFLEDIKDNVFDTHIMPQVYQMHRPELIDEFLLFDNLPLEIGNFAEKYNIKLFKAPNLNLRKCWDVELKRDLTDLVNKSDEVKNIIIDMYKEDFDLYNKILKERGK
jgi:hypothetical protein